MKISELIEELENAKKEKGDVEVLIQNSIPLGGGSCELQLRKILDLVWSPSSTAIAIWSE